MRSNEETIKLFAQRKVNSKTKNIEWDSNHVFCLDKVLYSYGSHFPLARYLGEKDGRSFFIKNSDKYSSSNSAHQCITNEHCYGPSISRVRLNDFLEDGFDKLKIDNIIFWQKPKRICGYLDVNSSVFYTKYHTVGSLENSNYGKVYTNPVKINTKVGEFVRYKSRYDDESDYRCLSGNFCVEEIVVLQMNKRFICSVYNFSRSSIKMTMNVYKSLTDIEKLLEQKKIQNQESFKMVLQKYSLVV